MAKKLNESLDSKYLEMLLEPLRTCAKYTPNFGKNETDEFTAARFQEVYGADPLYHWIGLDSEMMYAAHKAAGGMTSIYRQLGTGCERLFRAVIGDTLKIESVDISIINYLRNGNEVSVTLTINNQGVNSFPMNNLQQFFLRDNLNELFGYSIVPMQFIQPGSNQNATLVFNVSPNSQTLTFKASTADKYFLIDLI